MISYRGPRPGPGRGFAALRRLAKSESSDRGSEPECQPFNLKSPGKRGRIRGNLPVTQCQSEDLNLKTSSFQLELSFKSESLRSLT